MSNSDHSQDSHSQGDDHDHGSLSGSGLTGQEESLEDGLEVELSDQDYYDPHDDHAYYHDQNRRIEESWLEWERQTSISNPQNGSFHNQNIFQKPGSTKRRERRQRLALAQWNAQSNRSGSASSSASGSGSASGLGSAYMPGLASGLGLDDANSAAVEKLRRLGTYRPALASSMVHSFSDSSWEATQTAREKRLATKAGPNGTGYFIMG
ncbi:hypothetical protein BC939DRAFT_162552 [Gamsiella multidivaricata]|uniref:uncharacterized protein n=1 Tax=Gamsiella multidivaricata TaxID=101098 RepID=UPI00222048B8|nr:uncharacterized protein BC939DRAFT_162552 [Gamsiella multidivaricata]KAI7823291.1 hypothetical protein BC939DRAFT_162552 [Gamsiella multidivaricata]